MLKSLWRRIQARRRAFSLISSGATSGPGPVGDALLQETGDYLLLETGDYILLE